MSEHHAATSAPSAALLARLWALPFLLKCSSEAVLLSTRTLLVAVRMWKAAQGHVVGSSLVIARPALLVKHSSRGSGAVMSGSRSRGAGPGGNDDLAGKRGANGVQGGNTGGRGVAVVTDVCTQCAGLLSGWLRSEAAGGTGAASKDGETRSNSTSTEHSGDGVVCVLENSIEVVECLATAMLLLLQELPEQSAPEAVARPELQLALLDLIPVLCRACMLQAMQQQQQQAQRAAIAQLLIELLQHQLQPQQWLPLLSQNLALVPLLQAAAARVTSIMSSPGSATAKTPSAVQKLIMPTTDDNGVSSAAAGDTVMPDLPASSAEETEVADISLLELALTIARQAEGALMLFQQNLAPTLVSYLRRLLHPTGGGLLMVLDAGQSDTVTAAGGGPSASTELWFATLGAYAAGPGSTQTAVWTAVHQQWCVMLSFAGVFLTHLSRYMKVEHHAMDLLIVTEPRLLLAVQPQAATPEQPLTLAGLLEAERSLFLLSFMAQHSGAWQLVRPGSLATFRAAVASFLEFVARPSQTR